MNETTDVAAAATSPGALLLLSLSVASALSAAAAAIASFIQARKAAQSNEVAVFLETQKEYASKEMRMALAELAAFWREHQEQGVEVAFSALLANGSPRASELRGHSRLVSTYFTNIARLFEAGLISRRLAKLLIHHPGLNVFYEVAIPISGVKNAHQNSLRYKEILQKVVRQHGDGIY